MNLKTFRERPGIKLTIHFFVWILLMSAPYFLLNDNQPNFKRILESSWLPMLFYAALFYFNYLFAIDRFFFGGKRTLYFIANFVAIGVAALSIYVLRAQVFELGEHTLRVRPPQGFPMGKPPVRFFIYKDAISLLIPLIISLAIKTVERANLVEKQKAEKEKENLSSELQQLRYQLQPHFFFNSLNNIYSLVERSPPLAKEGIHSLSKMMRYVLYDSEDKDVELRQEIEFLTTYINLMKLRINNSRTIVQVEIESSMHTDTRRIAPLLFISLIENAFKHGIHATEKSLISFQLRSESDRIVFIAGNTNFPKNETDKSGSGIGLQNLVKRLDLLYPGCYLYKTEIKEGVFNTTLEIGLNNIKIA